MEKRTSVLLGCQSLVASQAGGPFSNLPVTVPQRRFGHPGRGLLSLPPMTWKPSPDLTRYDSVSKSRVLTHVSQVWGTREERGRLQQALSDPGMVAGT